MSGWAELFYPGVDSSEFLLAHEDISEAEYFHQVLRLLMWLYPPKMRVLERTQLEMCFILWD